MNRNSQTNEISPSLWISFRNFLRESFYGSSFLGLAFLSLSACVYAWIYLLMLWFYWLPYSWVWCFAILLSFFVAFVFITSQFYRKETHSGRRYMGFLCCGAAVASASVEFEMECQSDHYLPKRNTSTMGAWTSSRVVDQTMTACVRIRIIFLTKRWTYWQSSCKKCRFGVLLLPWNETEHIAHDIVFTVECDTLLLFAHRHHVYLQ